MKRSILAHICAILLTLALALALTACGDDRQAQQSEAPIPAAATAAPTASEPEADEVVLGGTQTEPQTLPTTAPAEGGTEAPTLTPEPAEETARPTPAPAQAPQTGTLADGTYAVWVHRELPVDRDGITYPTVGLVRYVELPDAAVSALRPGDTVQLHDYSFVVEELRTEEQNGVRMIVFNEGTERCFYIPETQSWRFAWPNDVFYIYEDEPITLKLAVDAVLTDAITPQREGRNIYGVEYDGRDGTIGALDSLQDFFNHYRGLEREYATVTVKNGEIASVVFEIRS